MPQDGITENAKTPVTPEEIARKLLVHNLKNLAAKIKAGQTLTPAELSTLRATANRTIGREESYAKNWVELADALGVELLAGRRFLRRTGYVLPIHLQKRSRSATASSKRTV